MPGFINVDSSEATKPDIKADITKIPWKWVKSGSAERIVIDNLAEHICSAKWIKVLQECHKALKSNGILKIKVPEIRPDNLVACFADPMHINYFCKATFEYYDCTHKRWKYYGRAYGIPQFVRTLEKRSGRFFTVELKAIK